MKKAFAILWIIGSAAAAFAGGFFAGKVLSRMNAHERAKLFVEQLQNVHVEDRAAAVERFKKSDPKAFRFIQFGHEGVRFII